MSQEMVQQPAQPQVVVVQQQAPVAVEPVQKCCMCIEIPCGAITLMVLEIFYLIGFVLFLIGALFVGAVASGANMGQNE